MIDFKAVSDSALECAEAILVSIFPAGKRRGAEFQVGSLNGEPGTSLSINIHTGLWSDFATGERGGDLVSLLAAKKGISQANAARELNGMLNNPISADVELNKDGMSPARGVVCDSAPFLAHPTHGKPAVVYAYRGKEGECFGFIFRFEIGGKKTFAPLTPWVDASGNVVWKWKGFPKPRPLYNLDRVYENPGKKILIVEGEKSADAISGLFSETIVVSWPGGANAFRSVDWTPLADRSVLIWPDADEPGKQAASSIADILSNSASKVQVLHIPSDKPKGWDAFDAVADGLNVSAFIAENLKAREVEEAPSTTENHTESAPYRVLGYDRGAYFYLPTGSKQIVSLTANEHRELQLLQLAPAHYWEQHFPGKEGTNWKAAANALIQQCHIFGIFSQKKIRGRGAWIDSGRIVYHLGDRLLVDGTFEEVHKFDTRYIYEAAECSPAPIERPASNAEAAGLLELCTSIAWKHSINGKLFAGWLVLAPIAGVLNWRPHIWLNGPSGSGKSWILHNILFPLLGQGVVNVESVTTEAGIRQRLGGADCLPVVLDEAESEDRTGQQRIQKILELARGASCETGASIIKGTASGRAQEFLIRTCFCFSSVGVGAVQRADVSRVTSLEVVLNNDPDIFTTLKEIRKRTSASESWCESIRARSLSIANIIRENAMTFSKAVAAELGDQRLGDQLGSLLAGAYSLTSQNRVTAEFAAQWVANQDWEQWSISEIDKDEYRAFSTLCGHLIRVDGDLNQTLSISELILGAMKGDTTLEGVLQRNGIKLIENYVAISNNHSGVARIFRETPWAGKWKDQFLRIDGAISGRERFNGIQQRCSFVPTTFFKE